MSFALMHFFDIILDMSVLQLIFYNTEIVQN